MKMPYSYDAISDGILDGEYDDHLDDLLDAISTRRNVLGQKRASRAKQLAVGTRVRLVGVSPKKAQGQTGILVKDESGRLGVRLDNDITSRLRAGRVYNWPAQCYVAIESKENTDTVVYDD
jgi:hypothetical protein